MSHCFRPLILLSRMAYRSQNRGIQYNNPRFEHFDEAKGHDTSTLLAATRDMSDGTNSYIVIFIIAYMQRTLSMSLYINDNHLLCVAMYVGCVGSSLLPFLSHSYH